MSNDAVELFPQAGEESAINDTAGEPLEEITTAGAAGGATEGVFTAGAEGGASGTSDAILIRYHSSYTFGGTLRRFALDSRISLRLKESPNRGILNASRTVAMTRA